jgi:hypothetical protein
LNEEQLMAIAGGALRPSIAQTNPCEGCTAGCPML